MTVHGVLVDARGFPFGPRERRVIARVAADRPVGLLIPAGADRTVDVGERFSFVLEADRIGLDDDDPRLLTMGAAGLACHPNEIAAVGTDPDGAARWVARVGGRGIWLNPQGRSAPRGFHPEAVITDVEALGAALGRFDAAAAAEAGRIGVPPHPEPWPSGDHLDPELLMHGDRRNVLDRYRYWSEAAIAADLARRARPFHVAVENWRRDRNIGTVVRNANGFGAAAVHIVGPRRWNRRGAMATDRYLRVEQHDDVAAFVERVRAEGLSIVAVDNVEGAEPIETTALPERCVLLFGQEGPGVSSEVLERADRIVAITQRGSTRSLNAAVAAGIAMYAWSRQHPCP